MKTRNDLIYKDECYEIMGLIFSIFNDLGEGHKEKVYENAIANLFNKYKIPYKQQLRAKIRHDGKEVGVLILDFLIYNKIVVEIKKRNYFSTKDIEQIYSYLKATNLKLGLLVHFTNNGVKFKRIVNINQD